ncbi:MAG: hypothetical protein AB8H79_07535 [Myxococcota bacterium]
MTLFDDVDALLSDALVVTAHAKPLGGATAIRPGDDFVATLGVENQGLGEEASTAARTAFVGVVLRLQATPFAAPLVDGEPVREWMIELGELIFGEASSRDIRFRAMGALDGTEPFVRVQVRGQLDVQRFFTSESTHQFATDIRRAPTHNAAADTLLGDLGGGVLPPGFQVACWSFEEEDPEAFAQIVDDELRFRRFVRERVAEIAEGRGLAGIAASRGAAMVEGAYMDVHPTGGTGSLAFALWFVSFDQGEAVSFAAVSSAMRTYLGDFDTFEDRRELRLFKGFDNDGLLATAMTVIDLPVVVDYGANTITLWAASLTS